MPTQNIDDLVRWFESLTPESAQEVGRYYTADAFFKDPFNELRGTDGIRRVFVHMFEQVNQPRFCVTGRWQSGEGAVLLWDFTFRMKRGADSLQTIRGATHLRFAADGTVVAKSGTELHALHRRIPATVTLSGSLLDRNAYVANSILVDTNTTVPANARVILRARDSVAFGSGFSVAAGATLTVQIQ